MPVDPEFTRERQRVYQLRAKVKHEIAKDRTTPEERSYQDSADACQSKFNLTRDKKVKEGYRKAHHDYIDRVIASMHERGEIGAERIAPHRHTAKGPAGADL